MLTSNKLTNLQMELLKMFSFHLNDAQLMEIRDLLAKYFAEKATGEMDRLWTDRNWSNETMDHWMGEHLRTSQKSDL